MLCVFYIILHLDETYNSFVALTFARFVSYSKCFCTSIYQIVIGLPAQGIDPRTGNPVGGYIVGTLSFSQLSI
jgi:hypothetical protein